jgi:hypothetical protein
VTQNAPNNLCLTKNTFTFKEKAKEQFKQIHQATKEKNQKGKLNSIPSQSNNNDPININQEQEKLFQKRHKKRIGNQ